MIFLNLRWKYQDGPESIVNEQGPLDISCITSLRLVNFILANLYSCILTNGFPPALPSLWYCNTALVAWHTPKAVGSKPSAATRGTWRVDFKMTLEAQQIFQLFSIIIISYNLRRTSFKIRCRRLCPLFLHPPLPSSIIYSTCIVFLWLIAQLPQEISTHEATVYLRTASVWPCEFCWAHLSTPCNTFRTSKPQSISNAAEMLECQGLRDAKQNSELNRK